MLYAQRSDCLAGLASLAGLVRRPSAQKRIPRSAFRLPRLNLVSPDLPSRRTRSALCDVIPQPLLEPCQISQVPYLDPYSDT